jgi:hypothetical protein
MILLTKEINLHNILNKINMIFMKETLSMIYFKALGKLFIVMVLYMKDNFKKD